MDVVILAAGMGSRFGGAKQVEPIDENGNFIIDYSIFDAIKVGFDKIVLIVKPKDVKTIRKIFDEKIGKKANIIVVPQSDERELLESRGIERTKPLGTAHAVLSAKNVVKDNFCIINADDFYGRDGYNVAYNYLKDIDKNSTDFALVGYKLVNTLSENGLVKRGICECKDGYVHGIEECEVGIVDDELKAQKLVSKEKYYVDDESLASMNLFCFTPKFFDFLTEEFEKFKENDDNLKSGEFLIGSVVSKALNNNMATMKALKTTAKTFGMTYREDKQKVMAELKNLVDLGEYPKKLW